MNIRIVLGTVNYTDYLRVSAAKVSDPGVEIFVTYINTPVSNYVLVIPGLDADNYYINFRDAPDTGSMGTLVSQAFVNALTNEWLYERRFYTIGSLPSGVTSTDTTLNDPYLAGRDPGNISVFKEGFRYLEPDTEVTVNDSVDGQIVFLTASLSPDEKVIVDIKYSAGVSSSTTAAGWFSETITVEDATYSIDSTDKSKRFMLDCSGSTQEITLPLLSALAEGDYLYLEHKRGGVQAQSKILTSGSDKILYNGFNFPSNELSEIWLAKGQSLYLRKESTYWEIINDYKGTKLGERMSSTFLTHPNWLPEDGRLLNGDEYPALYWWIRNILPSTHYITDDTVVSPSYAHPGNRQGQFVIHSTLKDFRMPNTQALSEKGLSDFDSYGADSERPYDYPGGWQDSQNKAHIHTGNYKQGRSDDSESGVSSGYLKKQGTGGGNYGNISQDVESSGGSEVRVQNIGVIYLRHI